MPSPHLAVASNAGQLKVGSFALSERMVKRNEVLRIERALGDRARFEVGVCSTAYSIQTGRRVKM